MIEDLKKAFTFIENISRSLNLNIVSEQNKIGITENLEELQIDLKKINQNIDQVTDNNTQHNQDQLNKLIANLNTSLVDLLSDIESLHEELVDIAKKYSVYLE